MKLGGKTRARATTAPIMRCKGSGLTLGLDARLQGPCDNPQEGDCNHAWKANGNENESSALGLLSPLTKELVKRRVERLLEIMPTVDDEMRGKVTENNPFHPVLFTSLDNAALRSSQFHSTEQSIATALTGILESQNEEITELNDNPPTADIKDQRSLHISVISMRQLQSSTSLAKAWPSKLVSHA